MKEINDFEKIIENSELKEKQKFEIYKKIEQREIEKKYTGTQNIENMIASLLYNWEIE